MNMNMLRMMWIGVVLAGAGMVSQLSWGYESLIEAYLPKNDRIEMFINKSHLIRLRKPVEQVSVVQPEIVEVQVMSPQEILLNAKSIGETSLMIWTGEGEYQQMDVRVKWNVDQIKESINHFLPDEAIEVVSLSDGIALKGNIHNIAALEQAVQVASSFTPKVLNFLNVPGNQQVLLRVRIAEVARNFREDLGFNFLVTDENVLAGNLLGNLASGDFASGDDNSDIQLSDAVTIFFGLQKGDVFTFLQALKREGMIHILAEPNLIARSGQNATFLAGGEYPYPVLQTGSGGGNSNAITIEFKEFGVRLNFTPTIVDKGEIMLDVSPEVSDLDFANGITIGGFNVPSLVSRRAHTVVKLDDGQTFAIAGLISRTRQDTKQKVPVLGDMPLLGNLFRGSNKNVQETELLILVTPHIVGQVDHIEESITPTEVTPLNDLYDHFSTPRDKQEINMNQLSPQPVEQGVTSEGVSKVERPEIMATDLIIVDTQTQAISQANYRAQMIQNVEKVEK